MNSVLIIDDDRDIAMLMKRSLEEAGYEACTAYNGHDGLELLQEQNFTLVILDIMMPGINGIEVCRTIRSDNNIPVIMVSAKGMERDKIEGLTTGADDYMVKPFSMNELVARVQSQIRRFTYLNRPDDKIIERKGLVIDSKKHCVEVYGKPVRLTPTEYSILELLASHPGQVFSSEDIYRNLWKDKYFEGNNTVMAHMWRLRDKIEDDTGNPRIIETVWGVGYKIEE